MSEKIAIDLGSVQKTLFLPLWGRALESQKAQPLLVDETALAIMEKVAYDFSPIAQHISPLSQAAWIMRSLCVDDVVRAFLAKYPNGTIVNLGCGLDTTFDRINNGTLLWYDLDLPDVISLRQQLIPEAARRKMIAASFLEPAWLAQIEVTQQVLFIAAGVFYYFTEQEIKDFLKRLADRFPGCEVLFDVASPRGVKTANRLVITKSGLDEKSFLTWGLENAEVFPKWDRRFRVVNTYFYFGKRGRALDLKIRLFGLLSDALKIQYMVRLEMMK